MPLLKRKRILAAKQESVHGTAVSLAAADALFNAMDVKIKSTVPPTERWGQGSLSKLASVPGGRTGKITFYVEICGGGSTQEPAWATTFLPACGWIATTHVYSPTSVTSNYKTLTMGVYDDGKLKTLKGCMGTWELECENGKPAKMKFEFTGVFVTPTDVAQIAPTYPTTLPPRWASSTFTIGAFTPKCSKLNIQSNNSIYVLPDETDASAFSFAIITDRFVKGTVDPEASLVATKDLWADVLAETEAAMSVSFGSAGNNTVTAAASKLQFTDVDDDGDREGILVETAPFQCNKSAAAGDDEFTLTFA